MAAAIIPLIASLAPTIIDLIASLVHKQAPIAEATLGTGTGPVKFADVFVSVMESLTKAKVAGQIDLLPDDSTVKTIIQAVVTSMKLTGLLGSAPTPTVTDPAAASTLTLISGQSVTISVK